MHTAQSPAAHAPAASRRERERSPRQLAFLPPDADPEPENEPPPPRFGPLVVALAAEALFALTVGLALARAETWGQAKDVLVLALPAVTLLLGVAVGLYFGRRTG